jgi:cell division protein FtsB
MIGLALIVASVLLYKAYKQHLKHNSELKQLREENARLKAQLEALRKEYQQLLAQGQWSMRKKNANAKKSSKRNCPSHAERWWKMPIFEG